MDMKNKWLLEIDFPYGCKYTRVFASVEDAFAEHFYLESEGLDVSCWSLREVL